MKLIKLTESDLHNIIMESVQDILKEWSDSDEEELNYDMQQLQKAFQKQNGTYHAKSSEGQFQTGDKVVIHTKKHGDIEGVIEDFDVNYMTYEETADVTYFDKEKNKELTMIGVPLSKIEKIN